MSHVSTASGTANRALDLVYKGYSLADYRAAAADPNYRIIPPAWSALTSNLEHLPPLNAKHRVGRPKQGPRKKVRIEESNGKQKTSSRNDYNADVSRTGGVGIRGAGAAAVGGGAGGGAAGGTAGVMGLSQGAMDLAQRPSKGEQA